MSLEQILLIAFLVVLPLIQYVVRLVRQQNELPEQQPTARPPSARRPPASEQQPPPLHSERIASGVPNVAPPDIDRLAVPPAGQRARLGDPVVRSHNAIDLRRAIVLMTIVGPCRAASPYDWDTG